MGKVRGVLGGGGERGVLCLAEFSFFLVLKLILLTVRLNSVRWLCLWAWWKRSVNSTALTAAASWPAAVTARPPETCHRPSCSSSDSLCAQPQRLSLDCWSPTCCRATVTGRTSAAGPCSGGVASRTRCRPPSKTNRNRPRSARSTCAATDSCGWHSKRRARGRGDSIWFSVEYGGSFEIFGGWGHFVMTNETFGDLVRQF